MKKFFATVAISAVLLAPAYLHVEAKASLPRAHAICKDGTISYSLNRSGTCSYHKGVRKWLY